MSHSPNRTLAYSPTLSSAPNSPLAGGSSSPRPSSSQPYKPINLADSPDLAAAPFTPPFTPPNSNPSQSARRGHGRQQSSLGSGSHLLRANLDGGDLGGGGSSWTLEHAEERRTREKGKGRGLQDAAVIESEEEEEVDEEAEAARIAAHLAQWSSTEKQRRATRRKNTQLVLPTAPVTAAQISQLSRAGSQLIRRPSQAAKAARASRQRSKSFTQVRDEDDDDEDAVKRGRSLRLMPRRRSSTDEAEGANGQTGAVPPLPTGYQAAINGVIDLDGPPKKPTLSTTIPARSRSQTPPPNSAASDATVGGSNPFASPTKNAFHASRFLEDLPPQSPTKDRTSEHTTRPSAPHHADSTPRASFDDLLGSPRNSGFGTPGVNSIRSNPFADAHEAGGAFQPSTAPGSAAHFQQALNGEAGTGGGGPRSGQLEPTKMPSWGRADSRDDRSYAGGHSVQDESEVDDDTSGTVGILDWLMCGCFRGEDDKEGHQAGRTNPME